jgi:hypothetical protein
MKKRRKRSPAKSASLSDSPIVAVFKKHADESLREISSGADVAERNVLEVLGDLAATKLKALAPENRAAIAQIALQRLRDGETVEDVNAWLSIKVLDQRLVHEREARKASGIQSERKRGGTNSAANRRAPWLTWRDWICKHADVQDPAKVDSDLKRSIVDVISFRNGAHIQPPGLDTCVPVELPRLPGRAGKPPSDDTIRRNLFFSRAK